MDTRPLGAWITPALVGVVAGTALQLQQRSLWPWWQYAMAVICLCAPCLFDRIRARAACILVCAAALAFCLCGLRSLAFEFTALSPSLEGRDLAVTGIVCTMPQRGDGGVRF